MDGGGLKRENLWRESKNKPLIIFHESHTTKLFFSHEESQEQNVKTIRNRFKHWWICDGREAWRWLWTCEKERVSDDGSTDLTAKSDALQRRIVGIGDVWKGRVGNTRLCGGTVLGGFTWGGVSLMWWRSSPFLLLCYFCFTVMWYVFKWVNVCVISITRWMRNLRRKSQKYNNLYTIYLEWYNTSVNSWYWYNISV